VSTQLAEKVYREYMTFFEKSQRTRRWSVFNDVPWDKVDACPRDPDLALGAETFGGVEMYLPDYVAQGINTVLDSFGQAWFQANCAYEESKHSLVLREYLMRTGQRTFDCFEHGTDSIASGRSSSSSAAGSARSRLRASARPRCSRSAGESSKCPRRLPARPDP